MQPYFTSNGLVTKALEHAFKLEHIMDLTRLRCLGSLFSMLHQACRNVAQYNANHPDFPMQIEQLERYIQVRTAAGVPSRPAACALSLPCPGMPKGRAAVGTRLVLEPGRKPAASSSVPQRYLVYAILWSLSGDSRLKMRAELGEYIRRITTVPLPAAPSVPIIDYEVSGRRQPLDPRRVGLHPSGASALWAGSHLHLTGQLLRVV